MCSSDSVEEENEIEEQSGRPDQRQIPVTERESENSTCREEFKQSVLLFQFLHSTKFANGAQFSCDLPEVTKIQL